MRGRSISIHTFRATVFVVFGLIGVCGASGEIGIEVSQSQVGKYERVEIAIAMGHSYERPFDPCEVEVDLLIESPSGESLVQPAFFCQDYERQDFPRNGKTVAWYYPVGAGSWKARFAPTEAGTYTVRARVREKEGHWVSGAAQCVCVPSKRKGYLKADPSDPRFLAFSEGEPFFAIGQNVAFVGETQYINVPKAEAVFEWLAENGANFVRIWTCCEDWAIAIEARKSAWTRSWTKDSPVVPAPGSDDEAAPEQCVELKGEDGASITVSPSHRVALRPNTRYIVTGRFMVEGATGLRLQVGDQHWALQGRPGWSTFREEFVTDENDYWLGRTTLRLIGAGTAWLGELSLKEAAGGAELLWEADVNRPVRGYYNQLDCFMLDKIVEAAERNGIYLMLCVLTRDLYMNSLGEVGSPAYGQAVDDAKKLMRYAVARWGYSTSVAAWEYFNEMDPGKPTDPFYAQVGGYLDQIDIAGHLKTTSTWHPSARDCGLDALDVAQVHHYLRPNENDFKDEVAAIIEKAGFLREHAPGKPALIGEFGLATEKWGLSDYMKQDTQGVHFHNCLWASTFARASGTAMFWWWDQLDRQDAYRHYRPLSHYLADVSFAGLWDVRARVDHEDLVVLGYQGDDRAYLWLFNKAATWWNLVAEGREPDSIEATIDIKGLASGGYVVEWWDTFAGKALTSEEVVAGPGGLRITALPFHRDTACKIRRR